MTALRLGGLVPFSTVDMPDRPAAVLFCQGCPWRCQYCHNGHLGALAAAPALTWPAFLRWLEPRRGFLEAVVFSGGEPLIQPGLPRAIHQVKELGFAVGLHTAGCRPQALRPLLPLLDWIGLDIKGPADAYARVTGLPTRGEPAWQALELTLASGIPYEIRTTWHPELLTEQDLERLAGTLAEAGAAHWTLQRFRPQGCADPALAAHPGKEPEPGFLRRLEARFLGTGVPSPARRAFAEPGLRVR